MKAPIPIWWIICLLSGVAGVGRTRKITSLSWNNYKEFGLRNIQIHPWPIYSLNFLCSCHLFPSTNSEPNLPSITKKCTDSDMTILFTQPILPALRARQKDKTSSQLNSLNGWTDWTVQIIWPGRDRLPPKTQIPMETKPEDKEYSIYFRASDPHETFLELVWVLGVQASAFLHGWLLLWAITYMELRQHWPWTGSKEFSMENLCL